MESTATLTRPGPWTAALPQEPAPHQLDELPQSDLLLRSMDRSLRTIKRISIWFLVISILGLLLGFAAVAVR